MLIPLHAKSDRSLGYGTASPSELAHAAAQRGLPAIALTDLETLAGQVELHAACEQHGLRAITGLELRAGFGRDEHGAKRGRLVLLARDRHGYAALCRLVTARATGAAHPPFMLAPIREELSSLFVLTDDVHVLDQLLAKHVPREALGLLLVRPACDLRRDAEIIARSRATGVPLVADRDVVMIAPQDHALHALQVAVHRRQSVTAVQRAGHVEPAVRALALQALDDFADAPDALAHADRIADACRLELRDLADIVADPAREAAALREISARCNAARPHALRYAQRLERELAVIEALGLARYFASAVEVADEGRRRGIPITARGSAVSSLVTHLLGLCPIDPVAHGLVFERFVHGAREEPPDIDLDVAHDRRDELIAWLSERYGADHVSAIASYATWQRRSAYRAGMLALGAPRSVVERTLDGLPGDDLDLPVRADQLPAELRAMQPLIERLIARPSHLSVHASGIVLSDRPLSSFVPFTRAPKARVTQYDGHALEALGLLKLDLLGNRALTERAHVLNDAATSPLPLDDPATWSTLRRANTLACFQVETPIVRSLLLQHPPSSLEELAAVLARARPGPASGGALIYEEDLIHRIAEALGCTMAEADSWRRLIARGEAEQGAFLANARRAGLASAEAKALWAELERFVAYAFSKAHALSFARLAYDSAYLKTHRTAAFACAVVDHHGGMYPMRTLVSDLQRSGVMFEVPSVQRSAVASSLHDGAVLLGLDHVKHLTARTKERIVAGGPFADLRELIERAQPKAPELRALIRCGACDDLAPLAPEHFPFAHDHWLSELQTSGTAALSKPAPRFEPSTPDDAARMPAYRALTRIQAELELLGMHVSEHPMRVLRAEAARTGCITSDALPAHVGQRVQVAGMIAALRRTLTPSSELMCFATFEDEHGLVEATVPPAALATLGDPLGNPGPYLVTGRVREDRGALRLVAEQLAPFHRRERVATWSDASA